MNTIKVYNFLDGKNICNIFANIIVNKINDSFPDAKTEISVINVGNFFVVKGKTSSNILINVADVFQDFMNKYDEEKSKKIRVIDTILYNCEIENEPINIRIKRNKIEEKNIKPYQELLNKYAKQKIYFNIKIEEKNKFLYYECENEQLSLVKTVLDKNFEDYKLIHANFSSNIYKSDKVYGSSTHNDKVYFLLLWNICNHLFNLAISSELDVSLYTSYKTSEIDENNILISINNNNHTVKTDWLESLVLDVFPFNHEKLKSRFDDCNNLVDSIVDSTDITSISKLHEISEIILF